MKNTVKIAIDGPSGAGKSTLAKELAKRLSFVYVDTGAIYRTVGYFAKMNGINPCDEKTLSERFPDIKIDLKWTRDGQRLILNGQDVTGYIRTPEMSMYASKVSALPKVRKFLFDIQRSIANNENVIMDGRDIGTVILPDATVKIFMLADIEIRAKRRYTELISAEKEVTYEDVLSDMIQRDKNDSTRKNAPCVPAEDAVILDNGNLSFDEMVEKVLSIIEEKIK